MLRLGCDPALFGMSMGTLLPRVQEIGVFCSYYTMKSAYGASVAKLIQTR